jgi:hypothetical protein
LENNNLDYPKIIFTYVDINGKETTLAKDIIGCCVDCEMEKIFDTFQDFVNVIADTVAEKYIDEDDKCDE